jgi:CobQ-like glutamine amidotransferase family enzyme
MSTVVESVIDKRTPMHLHIAHLYPAQMNIYGDRGNIIVLRQRSLWRGIDVTVDAIHPGATVDWSRYDLCFFGGGQDSGQALIADDFVVRHGTEMRAALADGVVMLAICGGYQLLGNYFKTHAGQTLPGIGALDVHTVGGTKRFIGNIAVTVDVPITQRNCVGFENHSGQTFIGAGARPLGTVIAGSGNNGNDKTEGAQVHNTFGCYMHGSFLPKNPQFADFLLTRSLERRYGHAELPPLDDRAEGAAQRVMLDRVR